MYFNTTAIAPHIVPASYLTALCETLEVDKVENFLKEKLNAALHARSWQIPALPQLPESLEHAPLLLLDNYTANPFVFGYSYITQKNEQTILSDKEKKSIEDIYRLLYQYLEPAGLTPYIGYEITTLASVAPLNLAERAILDIEDKGNLDFFLALMKNYKVECRGDFFAVCAKSAVALVAKNQTYYNSAGPLPVERAERALERLYERMPESGYTKLESSLYEHLIIELLDKKASNPYAAVVSSEEEKEILKLLHLFLSKGLTLQATDEPLVSFFSSMPYNRTRFMAVLGLKTENAEIVKLLACHTEFDPHKTKAEISRLLYQAHQAYKSSGAKFLMNLMPEEIEKYKLELKVAAKPATESKAFKI